MKIFLLIISLSYGMGAYSQVTYREDGTTFIRSGNVSHGSDGTVIHHHGNIGHGSDGVVYNTHGNITHGSDGSVSQNFGSISISTGSNHSRGHSNSTSNVPTASRSSQVNYGTESSSSRFDISDSHSSRSSYNRSSSAASRASAHINRSYSNSSAKPNGQKCYCIGNGNICGMGRIGDSRLLEGIKGLACSSSVCETQFKWSLQRVCGGVWHPIISGVAISKDDDDADGVLNVNDLCPNTPVGQIASTHGKLSGCAAGEVPEWKTF